MYMDYFSELSVLWVTLLNVTLITFIHLSFAALLTYWPSANIKWTSRKWKVFAQEIWLYENFFQIRRWKKKLPDGGAWFRGGFHKKKLTSRDPRYLEEFIRETCKGELTHLAVLACTPVFFLWNPPWASAILVVYMLIANVPCILTQRYNRPWLIRIYNVSLEKHSKKN